MPASGEIYQVTYVQSLGGQTMENVIHFRELNGLSTPTQIADSAEQFLTLLKLVQQSGVAYTQMIVKQMTPVAFDETIRVPTAATGGTTGGFATPLTQAVILTKRTGTAGKTHRGRMYIGGIGSDLHTTDGNYISTSGATLLQTLADNIIAMYGPAGTDTHLQIGVYSRTIGGTKPFTLAGWQPLTKLDVQPILGNQRRRRPGVGI